MRPVLPHWTGQDGTDAELPVLSRGELQAREKVIGRFGSWYKYGEGGGTGGGGTDANASLLFYGCNWEGVALV